MAEMTVVSTWGIEFFLNDRRVLHQATQELFQEHIIPETPFSIQELVHKTGRQQQLLLRQISRPGFVEMLSDGGIKSRVFFYQAEFYKEALKQGQTFYPKSLRKLGKEKWPKEVFLPKEQMREFKPHRIKRQTKRKMPLQTELKLLLEPDIMPHVEFILKHPQAPTIMKAMVYLHENQSNPS